MSTTTNLKLFKHDNPTTNTNQFDVEKALNENWDKVDKNAGEVASKIQTIEALKAENVLLKNQIPSATVVGETIHLEDSSSMQCQVAPIGASKQETREGYNLLNTENLTNQDTNGAKITRNKDGSFTLNGTTTNSFGFNIAIANPETLKADTTYTLKTVTNGTASSTSGSIIAIREEENTNLTNVNFSGTTKTYTPTVDTKVNYLRLYIDTGVIFTNFTVYPLLYEGTEEKEYEQYGASPSIEYEAPIESVGDNINLFNIETVTVNTYINHETGKTATSSSSITSDYIEIKANESITIVYDYEALQSTSNRGIAFYNENKTFLSGTTYTSTKKETTIIPNQNGYMRFCYDNNCTNVKVVQGSKATPYSPYGQGSIEVYNYTENLFDKTKTSRAIGSASGYVSTEYIPAQTGDTIAKSNATSLFLYDRTKTQITNVGNWTNKKIEVENVAYVRCNVLETEVDTFMLVKNQDLPSEYIQGQSQTKAIYTQQPFRSIGEVKDRFVKKDGVWYEEHNVARKELVGNESWGIHATLDNAYQFGYGEKTKKQGLYNIVSNYLPTYNGDKTKNSVLGGSANQNIQLMLSNIDFSDVDVLKEWLAELYNAGTPLYVDYVLAEPTLIPCTPEQVEVLEGFHTYKNISNISSDSIGELEVIYSKDIETLLNNISQAVLGGN